MAEGRKDDSGKLPYHLLPPELLGATANVLQFGARKYGERNWEKGMAWSRPFAALMRHMWAWWNGEKADPETGMSHLWHASCCIAFLIAYEERKKGLDDRPSTGPATLVATDTASAPDPTPRPGERSPGMPFPAQATCVWPDEVEQLET